MFTGNVPVASNPPKITSTPAVMFGPNAASGVNASVGSIPLFPYTATIASASGYACTSYGLEIDKIIQSFPNSSAICDTNVGLEVTHDVGFAFAALPISEIHTT